MPGKILLYSLLFSFLPGLLIADTLLKKEIQGKVIKIKDGDTIDILYNGKPLTIRLAHIDCPEKKQAFGNAAKQFISDKCFGQIVKVSGHQYDRNKRLIAVVTSERGENLNKELVKAGLAWHFLKYSTDSSYTLLEKAARKAKLGLWKDANPVAPWEWRVPAKN